MGLENKDKTKGAKMDVDKFEEEIVNGTVSASIRYGYLCLRGNVNITFKKADNEIKITGGYGM